MNLNVMNIQAGRRYATATGRQFKIVHESECQYFAFVGVSDEQPRRIITFNAKGEEPNGVEDLKEEVPE